MPALQTGGGKAGAGVRQAVGKEGTRADDPVRDLMRTDGKGGPSRSGVAGKTKKTRSRKDCANKVTVHVAPSTTAATLAASSPIVITVKYFIF